MTKWFIGGGLVLLAVLVYFSFRKSGRGGMAAANPTPEEPPPPPHVVTPDENAVFAAGGGGTWGAVYRNLDKLGIFDLPGYPPPAPSTTPTTDPVGSNSPPPISWRTISTPPSGPSVNLTAGTISWR